MRTITCFGEHYPYNFLGLSVSVLHLVYSLTEMETLQEKKNYYYISKLVRTLCLVNLAGCTLLHGPLKVF